MLLYTNNNNYISGKDNHFGSMDSFGIVLKILKKSVTFHYALVISAPINQLPNTKYPSKRKQKWKLVNDETFHGVLILMVILLCYIHAYLHMCCTILCYAYYPWNPNLHASNYQLLGRGEQNTISDLCEMLNLLYKGFHTREAILFALMKYKIYVIDLIKALHIYI